MPTVGIHRVSYTNSHTIIQNHWCIALNQLHAHYVMWHSAVSYQKTYTPVFLKRSHHCLFRPPTACIHPMTTVTLQCMLQGLVINTRHTECRIRFFYKGRGDPPSKFVCFILLYIHVYVIKRIIFQSDPTLIHL